MALLKSYTKINFLRENNEEQVDDFESEIMAIRLLIMSRFTRRSIASDDIGNY